VVEASRVIERRHSAATDGEEGRGRAWTTETDGVWMGGVKGWMRWIRGSNARVCRRSGGCQGKESNDEG